MEETPPKGTTPNFHKWHGENLHYKIVINTLLISFKKPEWLVEAHKTRIESLIQIGSVEKHGMMNI